MHSSITHIRLRRIPPAVLVLGLLLGSIVTAAFAAENGTRLDTSQGIWIKLNPADESFYELLSSIIGKQVSPIDIKKAAKDPSASEFNMRDLEAAIRRALRRDSFAIIYDQDGSPSAIFIIGIQAAELIAPQGNLPSSSVQNSITAALRKLSDACEDCVVENELDAVAQTDAAESLDVLQNSLNSPNPEERATALRWAMISADSNAKDALSSALMDDNDLVRSVAMEIVFEKGVDPEDAESILRFIEQKDSAGIQAAVYRLF